AGRSPSGQPSPDPEFGEKPPPVLDLYEAAPRLPTQQEGVCCVDEKPSIQARQRVHETKAAVSGPPVHVADRYRRMGALQLFCGLLGATGLTFTPCSAPRCFSDFHGFLSPLFSSPPCPGRKVLHLILDNGPTHAPKHLAPWSASLDLAFEVRLYWLPTSTSWLDQVEIIFSKVQRDVLTPPDFARTGALEREVEVYFAELNAHPKPIHWTYTKTKLLAKFGAPPPAQLAA